MMHRDDAMATAIAWESYTGTPMEITVSPKKCEAKVPGLGLFHLMARLQVAERVLVRIAQAGGDQGEEARAFLEMVGTGLADPDLCPGDRLEVKR